MVVSPGPMLFIYRLVSFLEHCLEDDGLSLSGGLSLNEQPFLPQNRFILESDNGPTHLYHACAWCHDAKTDELGPTDVSSVYEFGI